jgi:NitT/TauT family transport system substrate-binding protein
LTRLLAVVCACWTAFGATPAELSPVRIGLTREASAGPLYVAVAAGYFQAEGLQPQLRFFDSDATVSAAAAAGKVDFGVASLTAAFYRYAPTHGIKVIASQVSDQTGFPMYALLIRKRARDAGLRGVKDLSHKRIGMTTPGSGAHYGLASVATRFKLDPGDIKLVWLEAPARELSALSRGEVDAALLPYAAALRSARDGDALLRLSDFATSQQGVVFTTASNIQANRSLVEKFVRAYQRGTAEYHLNFLQYDDGGDFIPGPRYAEYLAFIARAAHVSPDLLAMTKTYCDRLANLDAADIDRQVKFWQREGGLDEGTAAADLLDLSFLDGR